MNTEKAEKFDKVKYKNQWQTANCDRINLVVKGKSINGYIKDAIQAQYEADTGEKIEL